MNQHTDTLNSIESIRASIRQSFSRSSFLDAAVRREAKPRLAVDINTKRLKSVVVQQKKNRRKTLQTVFCSDAYEGSEKKSRKNIRHLGRTLQHLIRHYKIRSFVWVLNSESVRTTVVNIPPLSLDDCIDALSLKAMKLIGTSGEKWVVNAARIRDTGRSKKSMEGRYILCALPETEFLHCSAVFSEAGMFPCCIALPDELYKYLLPIQHSRFTDESGQDDETGSWMVVDIENTFTRVYFYYNGELEHTRKIQFGGEILTRSLMDVIATPAGFIELEYEEAKNVKEIVGFPDKNETRKLNYDTLLNAAQIHMMLEPKLRDLVFELRRSIRYYQQQSERNRIERLIITGGTALLKGLDSYIEHHLKIRPHLFDPKDLDLLRETMKKEDERFLLSRGSAMAAALKTGMPKLNLLPAPVSMERLVRIPCRMLTFASVVIAAVLVGLSLTMQNTTAEAMQHQNRTETRIDFENKIAVLNTEIAEGRSRIAGLLKELGHSISILGLLEDLSRRIPAHIVLKNVAITNTKPVYSIEILGSLHVAGNGSGASNHITDTNCALQDQKVLLVNHFEASPFVKKATIASLSRKQDSGADQLVFQLTLAPYVTSLGEKR